MGSRCVTTKLVIRGQSMVIERDQTGAGDGSAISQ
jgi:hypothetical protein